MSGIPKKQIEERRNSPCWEWPGYISHNGYAMQMKQGKYKRVHRVIYEALIKDISEGLVADHLCRNRKCVNPFHIEIVTNRENVLRGIGITANNAKKTTCKQGHELEGNNLITVPQGSYIKRECRICRNDIFKRHRARKKSKK